MSSPSLLPSLSFLMEQVYLYLAQLKIVVLQGNVIQTNCEESHFMWFGATMMKGPTNAVFKLILLYSVIVSQQQKLFLT